MGEIEALTRTTILDANDWLDALEEAEDKAREEAERKTKR